MMGIGSIIGNVTEGVPHSATAVAMTRVCAYLVMVGDLAGVLPEEVKEVSQAQPRHPSA
jgi:hypothetical protein